MHASLAWFPAHNLCLPSPHHRYITANPPAFKDQLALFAAHGVVVAPHGSGLMNELFFVPGSGVVEIYPYHLHHNLSVAHPCICVSLCVPSCEVHLWRVSVWLCILLRRYPLLSAQMQLGHYPVHTYNGSDMWRRDHVRFSLFTSLAVLVLPGLYQSACFDVCAPAAGQLCQRL